MSQDLNKPGGSALWVDVIQADLPEMNAIGLLAEQSLWNGWVSRLTQAESGFLGDDCQPLKSVGDLDYVVSAGMGVVDIVALGTPPASDDAKTPTYQPIYIPTLVAASADAHDPALPRKDILTLKPSSVDDDVSSLKVFDGFSGFSPQNLVTRRRRSFTLNYIAGTPAPGPVAPATPAGEIRIALLDVPATSGAMTVTDERAVIGIRGDTLKPRRCRLVPTAISVEIANVINVTVQLQDTEGNLIPQARRFLATVFDDSGVVSSAIVRINSVGAGLAQSGLLNGRVVFDTSSGGLATLAIEDVSAAITNQAWLKIETVEGWSSSASPVVAPTDSTIGYSTVTRINFN